MRRMRRHLSYANVAATLALLFAMSGGALAANHYLINSTKQINPKVLKKLTGKTGARGPQALTGTQGTPGAAGASGAQGTPGAKGEAGLSALATLPSGNTESGTYGLRRSEFNEKFIAEAITFSIPLATPIPPSHILYTKVSTPIEHCSGPRHADPGYLCFYSANESNLKPERFYENTETEEEEGTSRVGLVVEFKTITTADTRVWGTYALTAP